MIRKAAQADIDAVVQIYDEVHTAEEAGTITVGWIRDVYPVQATAEAALARDDLFVLEQDSIIAGAGIINQLQVDVYTGAPWEHPVSDDAVCVLHTLVISPRYSRMGLGKQFVDFYETYARENHCPELRMDTNARNQTARIMYKKLGYKEIAVVPTIFNGIPGVDLVLLEKWLE